MVKIIVTESLSMGGPEPIWYTLDLELGMAKIGRKENLCNKNVQGGEPRLYCTWGGGGCFGGGTKGIVVLGLYLNFVLNLPQNNIKNFFPSLNISCHNLVLAPQIGCFLSVHFRCSV